MQFNPDINKQAVQDIFSKNKSKSIHPSLFFNGAPVVMKDEQKHLGMILDSTLNFHSHVKEKLCTSPQKSCVDYCSMVAMISVNHVNHGIIEETIKFIRNTGRFEKH